MAINVSYNENTVSLPEGTTVDEAKDILARIYPEVSNAEGNVDDEGNIDLKVVSGTKGADVRVTFGSTSISLPEGTTEDEAREVLAGVHPEIANATSDFDEDENVIRFKVKSGEKGN